MNFIKTDILTRACKDAIVELWNNEYPVNLALNSPEDLDAFLNKFTRKCYMLVTDDDDKIVAWFAGFQRENERWFSLLTASKYQGKGIGSKLLKKAMKTYDELNGWVIDHNNDFKKNGEHYTSPLSFYTKYGFEILKDSRLENEKISAVQIKWVKKKHQRNFEPIRPLLELA